MDAHFNADMKKNDMLKNVAINVASSKIMWDNIQALASTCCLLS